MTTPVETRTRSQNQLGTRNRRSAGEAEAVHAASHTVGRTHGHQHDLERWHEMMTPLRDWWRRKNAPAVYGGIGVAPPFLVEDAGVIGMLRGTVPMPRDTSC